MQGVKTLLCSFFLTSLLFGCSTNVFQSYSGKMQTSIVQLENGNLQSAIRALSGAKDVLYYLELGSLNRLDGNFKLSNQALTAASDYVQAWVDSYHNGTLGRALTGVGQTLLNDQASAYELKDYEKVMIPTYKALNYLAMGDMASARVEITRMYNLENVIKDYRQSAYYKQQFQDASRLQNVDLQQVENSHAEAFSLLNDPKVLALSNSYQNAFSHFLAGFMFQADNEQGLSRPGYLKALELNPNNTLLKQLISKLDQAKAKDKEFTKLLLIEEVGHAPFLHSVSFSVPLVLNNSCPVLLNLAFPTLVTDSTSSFLPVRVDSQSVQMWLFTDFNLMAARNLHDQLSGLLARSILRATKDLAITNLACHSGSALLALAANLGSLALSRADERAWTLLPEQIYATLLTLPKGQHLLDVNGQKETLQLSSDFSLVAVRVFSSSVYFIPSLASIP